MFSCFYFCYCVPIITYFHSPPRERIYEFGLPFSAVGVVSCLGHSRFADPLPQWALSSRDALRSSSVGVSVGVVSRKEPGRLSECWVPCLEHPGGNYAVFQAKSRVLLMGKVAEVRLQKPQGRPSRPHVSCCTIWNLSSALGEVALIPPHLHVKHRIV